MSRIGDAWRQFWTLEPELPDFGKYAAELDDNNVVVRVIVGQPDWAADNLDGAWICSETKVGVGWIWDGYEFVMPADDSLGNEDGLLYGDF